MGICSSKESGADSEVIKPSTQHERQAKNGVPKNEPLSQRQKLVQQKQKEKLMDGKKRSDLSGEDSTSNVNKTDKVGSVSTQAAASRTSNNEEKSVANAKDQEVKVLLLGAGESGKSTIIQQLKILHQNGFSQQEALEYRPVVYRNILEIGKDILEARKKFEVQLDEDSGISQDDIARIYSYDHADESMDDTEPEGDVSDEKSKDYQNSPSLTTLTQFPSDISNTISMIWNLPSTKELLDGTHRSKFYLMDSAKYFIENLPRISEPNYVPDEQDILRSRQKTSGIFDSVFDLGSNLKLHIYDVGGQRSERKKWIHCFDNVTLIIFCVSLSEYNQLLLEDQSQNRFQESLVLFDNVINSRWFARTSVVLFLNKIDLFAEKLQKVPLEAYFPDYTGGKDINKAAKYILWRFIQLNRANLSIYPHVTQATDTSNIKLVFAAIKETLLENTLKDTGVL